MFAKVCLLLCAVTQSAMGQCSSRAAVNAPGYAAPYAWSGRGLGLDGLGVAGPGLAYNGLYPAIASNLEFTPTTGGGLAVTSGSAIPPTGIFVDSENVFEGALAVAGELPFVGTAALEGDMPSAGAGAINHSCGNGVTAMESENAAIIAPVAAAIAPTAATFGPVSPLSPAGRFTPGTGFGLGNRFGFSQGLVY